MLARLGLLLLCLGAAACGSDSAGPAAQPPPDPGRMRVQISGAVQLTSEWQAYGVFRDLLASDTNEVSLMKGQNLDLSTSDSNFTLVFPGRLGLGESAIGRYVPGVASAQPAAFEPLPLSHRLRHARRRQPGRRHVAVLDRAVVRRRSWRALRLVGVRFRRRAHVPAPDLTGAARVRTGRGDVYPPGDYADPVRRYGAVAADLHRAVLS